MELAAYRETLRRRHAPRPSRSARPTGGSSATAAAKLDSKPDNVLIGADGRPRVVDFGLARVGWMDLLPDPMASGEVEEPALASSPDHQRERASQSARLTLPGVISGTPGYMSPEHKSTEAERNFIGPQALQLFANQGLRLGPMGNAELNRSSSLPFRLTRGVLRGQDQQQVQA